MAAGRDRRDREKEVGGGQEHGQELRNRLSTVGRSWEQAAADNGVGDRWKAMWR